MQLTAQDFFVGKALLLIIASCEKRGRHANEE